MDFWSPSMLQELSSNHTVIIFDNRGVGNTKSGSKSFSIQQFTNDTVGFLMPPELELSINSLLIESAAVDSIWPVASL